MGRATGQKPKKVITFLWIVYCCQWCLLFELDQIVINHHKAKGNEKKSDLVRQSGKPYREVLTLQRFSCSNKANESVYDR